MYQTFNLKDLLLDQEVSNRSYSMALSDRLQTKFPSKQLLSALAGNRKLAREQTIRKWRITALALSVLYRTDRGKFPTAKKVLETVNSSREMLGPASTGIGSVGSSNGLSNLTLTEYKNYLADPNFIQVLEELGIPLPNDGLTTEQMLALSLLSDFNDRRPPEQKLKQLGIPTQKFTTWLSSPKFQAAYRDISESLLSDIQPVVNTTLMTLATSGDLPAIKYLNEVNGRFDPAAKSQLDVRVVITRIIEILTSEISDPVLLQRIGARMGLLAGSLTSSGSTINSIVEEVKEDTSPVGIEPGSSTGSDSSGLFDLFD